MATAPFGKEKKGEVGVERLVDEGVYTAAFPLHDVSPIQFLLPTRNPICYCTSIRHTKGRLNSSFYEAGTSKFQGKFRSLNLTWMSIIRVLSKYRPFSSSRRNGPALNLDVLTLLLPSLEVEEKNFLPASLALVWAFNHVLIH